MTALDLGAGAPRPGVLLPGQVQRLRGIGARFALLPAVLAWVTLCALSAGSANLQLCLSPGASGAAAFDQALSVQWFAFRPGAAALEWLLMVLAMMLPLVAADLDHLGARAFRADRPRTVLAFLAGFLGLWLMLGLPMIALILWGRAGLQALGPALGTPLIPLTVAALWIISAGYRRTILMCHYRPVLPAAGPTLCRSALGYGARNAAACAASCAPLMLAMQVAGGGLAGMALLSVLIVAARRAHRPNPKGAALVLLAYGTFLTLI